MLVLWALRLGLAIKKKGLAREVIGIGRQETSLREAKDLGAIDEGTLDFDKGIIGADLIVLATPVNTVLDIIEILGKGTQARVHHHGFGQYQGRDR